MLRRLLTPRSERHACLMLAGMLAALLSGLISLKLALWWAHASLLG